jgi:hypothetical protein
MSVAQVVNEFANDKQLHAVIALIALDLILGIIAAVKLGTFAFSKVSGFLKDDVLGKVVPWFVIFSFAKFAPSVDIAGVDLNQVQTALWGLVVIALGASLISSLNDLKLPIAKSLPPSLATGENQGAPPTPSA